MRRTLSILSVCLLFAMAVSLRAQDSYHVLRSGSNCGKLTLTFEKLANGYRQCELREERRYQDIDDTPATWRRVLTITVDAALRPVSIRGREFTRDNEYHISGSCVQGTLYLTREDRSGAVESRREDCSGVPDVFLPVLLDETELTYPEHVFFTRDLETRPAMVRGEERPDGALALACGDGSEFVVAADGTILSWGIPALELMYTEMSSPVAGVTPCDIDCGVYWDAGQVNLPTPAENVRSMDVRLSLTRDVGARLTPEDTRQKFARKQPAGDASVDLMIGMVRHRHGAATLPVRDAHLLDYLGDSPLLAVTSTQVRDRAALLRAIDRNAASISGEIQRWMGDSFIVDPFVPPLSADRLVHTPRGTSFHAAVLMTALARSAGIPARLVLGLSPVEGRWRSKVWVEVWTGEWVSVDPSSGDFINDAVHIKLLHAADEAELRGQAQRLQGALRIDLLAVTEIDPGPAGALRTGFINGVYTDRVFKCAFRAPQGWMFERREMGVETELIISPQSGSDVRIEVLLSRNPFPIHTRDAFNAKVRALGVVLPDVEILDKGEIRLGARKVPYVLYSYRDTRPVSDNPGMPSSTPQVAGPQPRITTADCIFTIADRGYLIRFTAPTVDYGKHEALLQEFLKNFELLGQ